MKVENACMYLFVMSSFGGGQDTSAAHYCLYHGTSLCLENITFQDYVVGCLLCFFTGTHEVVC